MESIEGYGNTLDFTTEFFHPTLKKLYEFRNLNKGWHYDEGDSISFNAYIIAKVLLKKIIERGYESDAFPGLSGEVRITIYKDEHYLEFTIFDDRSIIFAYEIKVKPNTYKRVEYLEGISLSDAIQKIDKIEGYKWQSILESSTIRIMTEDSEDFKAWHSKNVVAASQL